MEALRSSNEFGEPNASPATSCTTGGKGKVPSGICHWSAVSADMRLWNRDSESGQIRFGSRSEVGCCCGCTSAGGNWGVSKAGAGDGVIGTIPDDTAGSHDGRWEMATWSLELERGRACNFSWRLRASWRAKGRLHSLQTYGLDPVSWIGSLVSADELDGWI